jgi:hypothetical protein
MADSEPKPEGWRVGLAFVLAPLAAAIAFSLIEDGPLWDVALIGAYGPAIVLGVPVYFLLRNRIRMRLVASVIFGGVIAALPWFVLTLLPGADQATVGSCAAVIDGKTTWCGFTGTLWWLGQIALYGAFGGLVFWICAAWQPRRI